MGIPFSSWILQVKRMGRLGLGKMEGMKLSAFAFCLALGLTLSACSGGSETPTSPSANVPFSTVDVRVGTGLVGADRLAALEAECARLLPLGAVRGQLLLADEENESCLVMQDIEGNEFCLD